MKVAPVSADLLIKLALLAAGVGVAVYAVQRMRDAVPDLGGAVDAAAEWGANLARTTLNPASDQNLAYSAANGLTSAATGGADTSFGGWVRSATSNDDERIRAMLEGRALPASKPFFGLF